MHDPNTVALDIPNPFAKRYDHATWGDIPGWRGMWTRWCSRPALITIWHRDRGGVDGACFREHLSEREEKLAKEIAHNDADYYFSMPTRMKVGSDYRLALVGPADCGALVVALWGTFAWRLERRRLSRRQEHTALSLGWNEGDNLQASFACRDSRSQEDVIRNALRLYKISRRPWWARTSHRVYRTHIHHWRIQIHPVQSFKRWAFSRCSHCRGRFVWNESIIGYQWEGTGPRWFRGEPSVAHHRCDRLAGHSGPHDNKEIPCVAQ
jgi:hypothetical protein